MARSSVGGAGRCGRQRPVVSVAAGAVRGGSPARGSERGRDRKGQSLPRLHFLVRGSFDGPTKLNLIKVPS